MKITRYILISLAIFHWLSITTARSQEIEFEHFDSKTNSSFRGLSVVNDLIIWVSGSDGWYGKSGDGGKTWEFDQIKHFESSDFRSIYAFDLNNAVIINAGSPTYVLKTTDGGENWLPVYQNSHADIFLDGIDFWNENEGILYGDPIDGKMMLLRTVDAGYTWELFPNEQRPDLIEGEASFAASGTNIRCFEENKVAIATGGKESRIFYSDNIGINWRKINVPILKGEASTGIFSMAIKNENEIVVVGGDYLKKEQVIDHVFYTVDGGKKWKKPETPTLGYRESVEYLDSDVLITTGPSGTETSTDFGLNWQSVAGYQDMHVVRKAREGTTIVMAGGKGMIILVK